MRAAQLRAELKAKKLNIPPTPNAGSFSLGYFVPFYIRLIPSFCRILRSLRLRKRERRGLLRRWPRPRKRWPKLRPRGRRNPGPLEVNSPRPEGRTELTEEAHISLHSDDFRPIGSPQYTSSWPTDDPEELSLALAKSFFEVDIHGLDTRWTNEVDCLYCPADQEHINATSGPRETDDLFRCWVEVIPDPLSELVCFLVSSC